MVSPMLDYSQTGDFANTNEKNKVHIKNQLKNKT